MKLNEEILEEKIREYRKSQSFSESTLMELCEAAGADSHLMNFNLTENQLKLDCKYRMIL